MASPIPIRFAYQIVSSSDGGPYYSWSAVGRQGISVFESRGAAGNIMVCIRRCTNTTAKENAEKTGKQKRRTRKHRADIATNPKNVSTKKRGGMEDWKGGKDGKNARDTLSDLWDAADLSPVGSEKRDGRIEPEPSTSVAKNASPQCSNLPIFHPSISQGFTHLRERGLQREEISD
jgi:hypothetical protein